MTENAETDAATSSDQKPSDTSPEVAELEADIERTREDLSHTVDQLSAKLDVKGRVRHRVEDTKDEAAHRLETVRERATDSEGRPTPAVMVVAGGITAGVVAVAVLAWRRRRAAARRSWWQH